MSKNDTRTVRSKEMFTVIEQYLTGNLSRKEFCQQKDIPRSTLQWWLTKYREVNGLSKQSTRQLKKFIPIELKTSAANSHPHCQIEYPNGVVLHLYGQFDAQLIMKLIAAN